MRKNPSSVLLSALTVSLLFAPVTLAQSVPNSYPASDADVIDAAKKEAKMVICSSTDRASAQPPLDDFRTLYPFANVEYNDIGTSQLYRRFQAEVAAGSPAADVLWSSAMDLQVKLAADGCALICASPESRNFAAENSYQNQAFGTTLEPAALIYDERLVNPGDLPATHAALADGKLRGKVATWDPEKSGVGFTLMSDGNQTGKDSGAVSLRPGKAQAGLYSSTGTMLETVTSGEALYGSNITGSYALLRQKTVPDPGMKFWKDGTIAFQRVAIIDKVSRAPNTAELFPDSLLPRRGQLTMANQSLICSLRADVAGKAPRVALTQQVGGAGNLKVIAVDKRLLDNLVPATRTAFLNLWRKNVKGQSARERAVWSECPAQSARAARSPARAGGLVTAAGVAVLWPLLLWQSFLRPNCTGRPGPPGTADPGTGEPKCGGGRPVFGQGVASGRASALRRALTRSQCAAIIHDAPEFLSCQNPGQWFGA